MHRHKYFEIDYYIVMAIHVVKVHHCVVFSKILVRYNKFVSDCSLR